MPTIRLQRRLFPFLTGVGLLILLFIFGAWPTQANTDWVIDTVDDSAYVGRFTSMAIVNNQPYISYFSDSGRNLKVASFNGTTWDAATLETAGSVGLYTSLAGINGQPAISYWNQTDNTLNYTRFDGTTWTSEVVDDTAQVGQYTSLAEVNGQPAISYWDQTNNALRYARFNGTTWDIETVDADAPNGKYSSLAVVDGQPAISYTGRRAALHYARFNGTTWDITVVDNGPAWFTSMTLVGGQPAISYYDRNNDELQFAQFDGTAWSTQIVDSMGSVGRYNDLAEVNGQPAISYFDESTDDLKYAQWDGSTWDIHVVDDEGDTGKYTSLVVVMGQPAISYFDISDTALMIAALPPSDNEPPVPGTVDAPNVNVEGDTTYEFTVQYTDNEGVNPLSIGVTDVTVTGPSGSVLPVIAASVGVGTPTDLPVTYTISVPGSGWSAGSNGVYNIALNAGEVADVAGNTAVAVPTLASFTVAIDVDIEPPVPGTVDAPVVTTEGSTTYQFTVRYTDNEGVDSLSVGVTDVTVTGPSGSVLPVTAASVGVGSLTDLPVTYTVSVPGSGWSAGSNGLYSIALNDGEIADLAGNTAAGVPNLASFTVAISLAQTTILGPIGPIPATETIVVLWEPVPFAVNYFVDVWDPYGVDRAGQEVDSSSCTPTVCSLEVPIDGVVGDYEIWVAVGDGVAFAPWVNEFFSVFLPAPTITAPVDYAPADSTVTIEFDAVYGAFYYRIDVFRPGSFDEYLPEAADICTGGVCTFSAPTNGEQGLYEVWIAAGVGPFTSDWATTGFQVGLPTVPLTSPTGLTPPADTLTLTFDPPAGADRVQLDIYTPGGGFITRFVEVNTCGTECAVNIDIGGLQGNYSVFTIASRDDGAFGEWALSEFNVGFDTVQLLAPLGDIPLQADLILSFEIPDGADFVSLDVYYPDGTDVTRQVSLANCPTGTCNVAVPSNGQTGEYTVWAIPGSNMGYFGVWESSTFTVVPSDLTLDSADMLGSALPELPALDTSAVEAAVEGPGN